VKLQAKTDSLYLSHAVIAFVIDRYIACKHLLNVYKFHVGLHVYYNRIVETRGHLSMSPVLGLFPKILWYVESTWNWRILL